MPIPHGMQSHLHHKPYHDTQESDLDTQQHLHRQPVTPTTLKHIYDPRTPSRRVYSHHPSPSVEHTKYSPFPSLTKPPQLLKPKGTLLPLIAKFEILDATSFGFEYDKNLAPRPLKFKRREIGAGDVTLGLKFRATGLRKKVLGLLERSERSRKETPTAHEVLTEVEPRTSQEISTECQLQREFPDHQSKSNNPALPRATKQSCALQYSLPFQPSESMTQHLLVTATTWRPHSKRRKESALGLRRESKIKDKIRFFDGSMDNLPHQTHSSEVREEADYDCEGADAFQSLTQQSSIALMKNNSTPRNQTSDQLVVSRIRAETTPLRGFKRRNGSAASVGSSERNQVQALPTDCGSILSRERERGRTRDRIFPSTGPYSVRLALETVIRRESSERPSTPVQSLPKETKDNATKSGTKRKAATLYIGTPRTVKGRGTASGTRVGLRDSIGAMLLEDDRLEVNMWRNAAEESNNNYDIDYLTLPKDGDTEKTRSTSMVQARIHQFSIGKPATRRHTSPTNNGCLKANTFAVKEPADTKVTLDEKSVDNLHTVLSLQSVSGRRIREKARPAEPTPKRLSTIKSRINLFEKYTTGHLHNREPSIEFNPVSDQNTEIKFDGGLNQDMTWAIPNDFGSALKRTRRAPTPAPSFAIKNRFPAENALSKGKQRLKQWWNEGREPLPSETCKGSPRSTHKMRAQEERSNRRVARGSPEKPKGKRRDGGVSVQDEKLVLSTNRGSSLDSDMPRIIVASDNPVPVGSPAIVKEIWIHSRSPTPSFSSIAVETSHGNGTPMSTLKLVLENRTPSERNGRERNTGELNINIVDTVVAQCALSQPRPKRLLEIQRMVKLCRRFAEKDGSWGRETIMASSSEQKFDGRDK